MIHVDGFAGRWKKTGDQVVEGDGKREVAQDTLDTLSFLSGRHWKYNLQASFWAAFATIFQVLVVCFQSKFVRLESRHVCLRRLQGGKMLLLLLSL